MNQVILSLFLTSFSFFLYVPFFAHAETEIDPSDPISKYQHIIIAVFSVLVGSLVATLLVQYWNNKKQMKKEEQF
jgi:uncharacterized PurR-regulated membrane protein YhhQ (DUF165 family)